MAVIGAQAGDPVQPRRRFQVVVVDVWVGRSDPFDRSFLAEKIRREDLDGRSRRCCPDFRNAAFELFCAAIGKIVGTIFLTRCSRSNEWR